MVYIIIYVLCIYFFGSLRFCWTHMFILQNNLEVFTNEATKSAPNNFIPSRWWVSTFSSSSKKSLSHLPQKFRGKLGFAQDVWKKTNIFCQMVVLMLMHSGTKQKITFNKSMQQLQKRLKKKTEQKHPRNLCCEQSFSLTWGCPPQKQAEKTRWYFLPSDFFLGALSDPCRG